MQPYWIPYAGYFRLMAEADVFVVLDDVQFPRRGYVHRNKLVSRSGEPEWISLPLQKAPREIKINELKFHNDAESLLEKQKRKFPRIEKGYGAIDYSMLNLNRPVVDLLVETLQLLSRELNLEYQMLMASEIGESDYSGAERIVRITKALGGRRYVNAPGGRHLYDESDFAAEGIQLAFLPDWSGSVLSILEVLSDAEVRNQVTNFDY